MDSPEDTVSTLSIEPLGLHQRLGLLIGHWWIAFSLSSICVVSGHLMIKAGLNTAFAIHSNHGPLHHIMHLLLQPEVFAGLAIYVFGTACWMIAVNQKDISFLYPLSSVNYVLVAVASGLLLSESVSPRRAGGIALIVLGMFLLTRPARGMRP